MSHGPYYVRSKLRYNHQHLEMPRGGGPRGPPWPNFEQLATRGRGRRSHLPNGPQALTQVKHWTRARIVSRATRSLECSCSPLEMLGNYQPDESHVHGGPCAPHAHEGAGRTLAALAVNQCGREAEPEHRDEWSPRATAVPVARSNDGYPRPFRDWQRRHGRVSQAWWSAICKQEVLVRLPVTWLFRMTSHRAQESQRVGARAQSPSSGRDLIT